MDKDKILREIATRSGGDFGKPTEWSGPWVIDPQKLAAFLAENLPTRE